MESQNLKQRTRDESTISRNTTNHEITTDNNNNNKTRKAKRMVMARRGLRSLTIAVAFPLSLTLATTYCSGYGRFYGDLTQKPFWYPPFWALIFASLASSFFTGLSAWLVWAEGGFHRQPTAFYLYLAQLILGISWAPITFTFGATRLGLVICVALFAALVGCSRSFRKVNPIAADLIKPCLAWVAFMIIVNLKLLYI